MPQLLARLQKKALQPLQQSSIGDVSYLLFDVIHLKNILPVSSLACVHISKAASKKVPALIYTKLPSACVNGAKQKFLSAASSPPNSTILHTLPSLLQCMHGPISIIAGPKIAICSKSNKVRFMDGRIPFFVT
ncbi:hypothetical protein [Segetibacter sp.]|uniref:hypothetical protein n=1 Tax=Segetibacter sp. TaxID=2231182 RepID=UPI0026171172|nr:hypothetical protein [Segetibacter sp.]